VRATRSRVRVFVPGGQDRAVACHGGHRGVHRQGVSRSPA
jgi:hypothetical protein